MFPWSVDIRNIKFHIYPALNYFFKFKVGTRSGGSSSTRSLEPLEALGHRERQLSLLEFHHNSIPLLVEWEHLASGFMDQRKETQIRVIRRLSFRLDNNSHHKTSSNQSPMKQECLKHVGLLQDVARWVVRVVLCGGILSGLFVFCDYQRNSKLHPSLMILFY